jgi:hypothetical protein
MLHGSQTIQVSCPVFSAKERLSVGCVLSFGTIFAIFISAQDSNGENPTPWRDTDEPERSFTNLAISSNLEHLVVISIPRSAKQEEELKAIMTIYNFQTKEIRL